MVISVRNQVDFFFTKVYNSLMNTKIVPVGKSLIVLVGPSGAGKSHLIGEHFQPREVVSSDALREEFTGDPQRHDKEDSVWSEFRRRIEAKINAGQRVVADATHLRNSERKRTAEIGKILNVPVIYMVVNRAMNVKFHHGGWRNEVFKKGGRSLMEVHEDTFNANLKEILRGDGLADMVIDTRTDEFEVAQEMTRDSKLFLPDLLDRGYEYVRVIGDVHGNVTGLEKALDGIDDRGATFFLFLGDIVDYGSGTLRAADAVSSLVRQGEAISLRGNHERKIFNFVVQERGDGFRGTITHGNDVTTGMLKAADPRFRNEWEERFISLVDLSPDWIQVGPNHLFVHAAAHRRMWDNNTFRAPRNSALESNALYGQTTGETDPNTGFPERLYDWVDEIPAGKTVTVGHAILSVDDPVVKRGMAGGTAVFLDTGSSKTEDATGRPGKLSWSDFEITYSRRAGERLAFMEFGSESD